MPQCCCRIAAAQAASGLVDHSSQAHNTAIPAGSAEASGGALQVALPEGTTGQHCSARNVLNNGTHGARDSAGGGGHAAAPPLPPEDDAPNKPAGKDIQEASSSKRRSRWDRAPAQPHAADMQTTATSDQPNMPSTKQSYRSPAASAPHPALPLPPQKAEQAPRAPALAQPAHQERIASVAAVLAPPLPPHASDCAGTTSAASAT